MTYPISRLMCSGCGWQAPAGELQPYRCWHADSTGGGDHVLVRQLDLGAVATEQGARAEQEQTRFWRGIFLESEPNPFVRFRLLSHAYHVARAAGQSDSDYVALVRRLDDAITQTEGHGFRETPCATQARLAALLGLAEPGAVWVKDETGNVSGSHKARHTMGLAVWLDVTQRVAGAKNERTLAIASCGNAALGAAVVACAARRPLDVYIPEDAHPGVVERLQQLGARLVVCRRHEGVPGDPAYLEFLRAVDAGAVPFTCQGNQNGLTIEGGMTLAWEMVAALLRAGPEQEPATLDRIFIQVGGGALASSVIQGLQESVQMGLLARMPRVHAVQTEGAHPLKVAYDRVAARVATIATHAREAAQDPVADALAHAARHRGEFMSPWPTTPHSIAHGILDDETYDWLAVVRGMLTTGGSPVVVDEHTLRNANALGRQATSIRADFTGTAGLAGCLTLARANRLPAGERVAVVFTGVERDATGAAADG